MSLKLMQLLFQIKNKIIRNFHEMISKIVSPLVVGKNFQIGTFFFAWTYLFMSNVIESLP